LIRSLGTGVSILPMLLVFIFFQRCFIQGMATTGVK
jgi:ABC-type glycerol-3-phosphate transport system permease component